MVISKLSVSTGGADGIVQNTKLFHYSFNTVAADRQFWKHYNPYYHATQSEIDRWNHTKDTITK